MHLLIAHNQDALILACTMGGLFTVEKSKANGIHATDCWQSDSGVNLIGLYECTVWDPLGPTHDRYITTIYKMSSCG